MSICPYCDFDRQATGFASIPRYVEAVAAEIRLQPRRPLHSIFFGGGTPSLMEPVQVERVLDAAADTFDVLPDCEVTMEANPGECTVERLADFRRTGVNRVSIGVQSLDDATLTHLGRRHSAEEARQAVAATRRAGFDNLSLDFMLGLSGMTSSSWSKTLEGAIALAPEHLSCYILTMDERVPMGRDVARGRLRLPDDDAVADQYELTQRRLAAAGYEQYEVSNWCLPDRACRHNLTYWRDEPYVGVGAGAAGWADGLRWKNSPSPKRYLASVAAGEAERVEEERPDQLTRVRDFLATGLRLREGIDPVRFRSRFGVSLERSLRAVLPELLDARYLEWCAGRLRIAADHVLVTSEILVRIEVAIEMGANDGISCDVSASGRASTQSGAQREQVVTLTP